MDSVVLPTETKDLILKDLDNFLEDSTAEWYAKHGICYKRSYLLYGPPGTGKTSFLSAIASKYDRNLCFLQAGHPLLTDSSLHSALNQAPEDSILVMEDIDSLFTVDRKSDSKSPLTFSGILNALDGLASPQGNIFFLTSNHPERLDPAMLRHGRVDVRAEFPAATEAQVAGLFRSFYPDADVEAAVTFSHALKKEWGSMNLAALQVHIWRVGFVIFDFFFSLVGFLYSESAACVEGGARAGGRLAEAAKRRSGRCEGIRGQE